MNSSKILKKISDYFTKPEVLSLLVFLVLLIALAIINIVFLPFFFSVLATLIILGVIFLITRNQIRLIKLESKSIFREGSSKSLINNLNEGVLVYDSDFRVIEINPAAQNIFNLQATEVIGKIIEPGLVKNPKFKNITQIVFPSLAPYVNRISESASAETLEISLENPPLKLRTTLITIIDEGKKTIGFMRIIDDRTRERGIVESKKEFVTVAAHQLRTPLTGIHWAFESLIQNEEKKESKEILEEGLKLSERTLKIVNDLLDVAKIEEGRFDYKFEENDFDEIVRKILNELEPLAKESSIKLYYSSREKVLLETDPEKIGIVIMNLVDNAIRYSKEGSNVTVELEIIKNGSFLKLSVKDTGVGISEEDLKMLFNKFHRGKNVTEMEPDGSGLGLFIAKNIVERHGGEIGAESILGRGSVFWFTLPLKKK